MIDPITMPACTTTSLDLVPLNVTGLDLSAFLRKKKSLIVDSPILTLENDELPDEFEFEEEELPFLESEIPMIKKDGKVVPFYEFISKVRDDYPQPETTKEDKKVEPTQVIDTYNNFQNIALETIFMNNLQIINHSFLNKK